MLRGLFVMLTGCSLVATSAPPEGPVGACNDSEVTPIVDTAVAVSYALLGALVLIDMNEGHGDDDEAASVAVMSGIGAGIWGLSGAYGFSNIRKCRRRNQAQYEEALRAQRSGGSTPSSQHAAWELTKQAQAAARNGDCETVAALDQVVHGTDPDFHRTVFARDAAIIGCMGARPIPLAPPSATPAP